MRPRVSSVRITPSTLTPRIALDPAAADRLAVGDHGERLEGGLGQPGLLAVEEELLDDRAYVGAGCRPASHPPTLRRVKPRRAAA